MGETGASGGGFLSDLFDIRFRRFVTTRIVTALYVLGIALLGLMVVAQIAGAFSADPGFGVVMLLVIGPLIFLVGVLYLRVLLEVLVVLFRIGEDTSRVRELLERGATPPEPPS